jgi:alcohol dehydrogenase class IV
MPAMLEPCDWSFPVPIRYGPGRLAELGEVCRGAGTANPLIVTDRGSRNLPFVAEAERALARAGLSSSVFAEVSPNPTDREVAEGRKAFRAGRHDGVIALGGGSGMDAGKAVSLVARNERPLWEYDFDRPPPAIEPSGFVPLVCVPSTAGTGAETESTAMITDTARAIKGCVWHPRQKPVAAILDPAITEGLPRNLTAWTGCDALVHAIEAYCVPMWHPMCDGIALEALKLISGFLPRAVDYPHDLEARGAMLVGSCLAGVSFLKGLGLVHAVSHMVGARYDTHHGLTNAVLLPAVLRYNEKAIAPKVPALCWAMGLEGSDFASLYRAVTDLLDRLDIPKGLAALGVEKAAARGIAAKAHADPARATNPAPAPVDDIEALIVESLEAAR